MVSLNQYISRGSIYGKLMLLIGCLILVPVLVVPFYPAETDQAVFFFIPSSVITIIGLLCCRKSKKKEEQTGWQSSLQKGSAPVLFAWCIGFLAGAIPFVISGQLGFVHALFESVSGWTTTGLTVMDVTVLPHIFLFHRSFMQYCGGLGFILMVLMLVGSKQAVSLYSAEGHPDKLMPNLKKTVRTIFMIYNGFFLLGTTLFTIFGMHLFDAVCHTMSALSTAGFTTQANSIGTYGSLAIEAITIFLMLIGSTNFAVLLLFTKFKFKKMFQVSELRFMFGLIAVFVPLIGFSLMKQVNMGFFQSMHHALFGVVTTFTTTGYSTMNYANWPAFALGLTLLLMVIGGSLGSTAGGIKLSRTYLLLRIVRANIKQRLSPSQRVTIQNYNTVQGKTPITPILIADTMSFIFCYFAILIIGTLLITISEGCSLFDALFEFTSAFGTVGISNGLTNPSAKSFTLIVEIFGMILGRLEIFVVFIGISDGISKVRNRLKKM